MKTEKLFDKLFHPKADGHISKPETIAFAESYHKQKVESINNRTMKLIKMLDYVLNAWKDTTDIKEASLHNTEQLRNIINYANFLKQPLKLGMFIPCDEDGNVLDRPELSDYDKKGKKSEIRGAYEIDLEQYQQALSNVIFKGFYLESQTDNAILLTCDSINIIYDKYKKEFSHGKTIEDLTDLGIELIKDI